MWNKIIFLTISVSAVFGLKHDETEMFIDYFNYRQVKFVCIITCEQDNLINSHRLAKQASKQQIAVSVVDIDNDSPNPDKLRGCFHQIYSTVGVFIDSQCSGFENVMNFASSKAMFDAKHKWLIIGNDTLDVEIENDTRICSDDKPTARVLNSSKAVATVEYVNTSIDSDIILGFHKDLVMIKNLNDYKYYDRWDYQEWTMRMIVVYPPSLLKPQEHFRPDMIIGDTTPPVSVLIQAISMASLHVIAERHNFRFVYTTSDRWVGSCKQDDTVSVLGSLSQGYQDVSPTIRTSNIGCGSFDFIHPAMDKIETRYFYRIPTTGPGKYENQFFRPLGTDSWISVFFVISLCGLTLLLSAKLEQRPMPVQYAAFSVAASFCQQFFEDSGDGVARRLSQARRISIFVTGLFCVLIYNYYTSSVVSWLLNGPPPSITTLQELFESPLQLVYEDVGYSRSWLQNPRYFFNKKNAKIENELRKKVLSKKRDLPLLVDAEEGIEIVKAGGFAFHTEINTAYLYISRKFDQMEICELGSLKSMKSLLLPAVQKNSPYKEFLVWSTARLTERGIVSCIQRRLRPPPVSCEGSSPRALALGGAAPAFMLLAFGYLLAVCILFIERMVHRRKSALKI